MIRVVHVLGSLGMGGIENFLMNIYRNIDKEKIQFDFIINQNEKNYFIDEIKKMGGEVYEIPSLREKKHFEYMKVLKKILKENNYDIIHSHYEELSGFILKTAKKVGIEERIVHSHNTQSSSKGLALLYKNIAKRYIEKYQTKKVACSKLAGKWLYENDRFETINNGIEAQKYIFNETISKIERKKLGFKEEDLIVGHVGRFNLQKNHNFLIDIFLELVKINENYKLILIGDGELKDEIVEKIKKLNLQNKIMLLGIRKDVEKLFQIMDIFLFPSLYEGLGIVLIEAQAAGLKCFVSENIPDEADMGCSLIKKINLSISEKEWAKIIDKEKIYKRENILGKIKNKKYSIEESVKELENIYLMR